MSSDFFYKITKKFLLHEGQLPEMNIMTYVQSITEIMNNKMQEQIQILEQKVTILEEIKEEIKNAKIDS